MSNLKFSMWFMTLLLLLSAVTVAARPVRPITIARRALEAQFSMEKMSQSEHEWPERVTPGGPDGHHHLGGF
ncbi:UNVERIFIED_CONTAM: hypothetical protein Slati_1991000 [Sesamum latifolium]|uniref:Uncharacterized protein n=1 Tax=Sesamum latifolium TaxID=2727402 RepID=A0AAW2WMS6_9LAMI